MPRDWTQHDAQVPYRDERRARMNGTNRLGKRPHVLIEPERLRLPRADNDNAEPKEKAA